MRHATLGVTLACLLGTGCHRITPAQTGASPQRDTVTIVVINRNFYDANIYSLYDGQTERRLGLVPGFSEKTFEIDWHPHDLYMVMRLVGAGRAVSNPLLVSPGDLLELQLQPDLHLRAR